MNTEKDIVHAFACKYRINHINYDQICDSFIHEMENGLIGKESSLRMAPAYFSMDYKVPVGEYTIAIDAGGTHFRVAVMHFDDTGRPVTDYFKKYPMPGTYGEINKDQFFGIIADHLRPVMRMSNTIGFCFSYAADIMPDREARLTALSKEVRVRGIDGVYIGRELAQAIKQAGYKDGKHIVMLNDTIASLMGGSYMLSGREFDGYIGLIMGTGINTCYLEKTQNIQSADGIQGKTMLVNMESGGFTEVPRTVFDMALDTGTSTPGRDIFEKMVAGAYIGDLTLLAVKKAAEEGLFPQDFCCKVGRIKSISAKDISDFLYHPYAEGGALADCCSHIGGERDRMVLYHIINAFIERAAMLAAANLTAIIRKTRTGLNPCRPVCIVAEGTTFDRLRLFKEKLNHYVGYRNQKEGLYCDVLQVENSTMIGTAIAGLTG